MSPMLAKRPCRRNGCSELVERGEPFCQKHKKAERKRYDKDRGTPAERGLDTRWGKLSKWILKRHPVCQECNKQPATLVHHHIPISEAPHLRLRADGAGGQMLRALCRDCHERIERERGKRWGGVS